MLSMNVLIGSQLRWRSLRCVSVKLRPGPVRLNLPFLQLVNDLRDSARINDLHARLSKVDDIYHKVDDIHTILLKFETWGARPISDSLFRQEMPLKPEIFHGRDDLIEGIAQLLLQEKTSRVCILGPGGMGKTSVSLAVAELPLIKEWFSVNAGLNSVLASLQDLHRNWLVLRTPSWLLSNFNSTWYYDSEQYLKYCSPLTRPREWN